MRALIISLLAGMAMPLASIAVDRPTVQAEVPPEPERSIVPGGKGTPKLEEYIEEIPPKPPTVVIDPAKSKKSEAPRPSPEESAKCAADSRAYSAGRRDEREYAEARAKVAAEKWIEEQSGTLPVPVATITTSVKQLVPGRLVILSATESKNVKRLRWYVEPSTGVDLELVEDGRRAAFVPTRSQTYTFRLVVTSPDGEIADTTLRLEPLKPATAEDDNPAIGDLVEPAAKAMTAPPPAAPTAATATRDLAATVRRARSSPAALTNLITGLRLVAGGLQTGGIRGDDEFGRAVATHITSKVGDTALADAALAAADIFAGETEDAAAEATALHKVASLIEQFMRAN